MRYDFANSVAGGLDMAPQESCDHRFSSFKRNMGELGASQRLDDLQVKVGWGPYTCGADTEFTRILFGIIYQFSKSLPRRTFLYGDSQRKEDVQAQIIKILDRIVVDTIRI